MVLQYPKQRPRGSCAGGGAEDGRCMSKFCKGQVITNINTKDESRFAQSSRFKVSSVPIKICSVCSDTE
jgi:hypothetical protein